MVEVPAANVCACGAVLNEGAKFCVVCGRSVAAPVLEEPAPVVEEPAPVVEEPVEEVPAANICACGAVLNEGAKFCVVCGRPVVAPVVEEPTPVVEEPASVVEESVEEPQIETPSSFVPPIPTAPAVRSCPVCGARAELIARFCNICGESLPPAQVTAPSIPAVKRCPLCGTVVPMEATVCSGCGVAFRVRH